MRRGQKSQSRVRHQRSVGRYTGRKIGFTALLTRVKS